jgi:TonB family protein
LVIYGINQRVLGLTGDGPAGAIQMVELAGRQPDMPQGVPEVEAPAPVFKKAMEAPPPAPLAIGNEPTEPTSQTDTHIIKSEEERKQELRDAVAKKGLLGVLGNRGGGVASNVGGGGLDGAVGGGGFSSGAPQEESFKGQAVDTKSALSAESKKVAGAAQKVVKLEKRQDQKVESTDQGPTETMNMKEAEAVIKRTVDSYLGSLRYIYNRELRKNPDLEGKITIAITITPEGAVTEAKLVETTMNAPEMEQAILGRVRKWTFPPVAPKVVTVKYPFVFFPSM